METLNINGSAVVSALLPAGVATVDSAATIAKAGFVSNGESQADVISFSAAPAPFDAIFAQPALFQPDQTVRPVIPPAAFNFAQNAGSWLKVINNTSGQIVTVKGINVTTGAVVAAGLAIAAGAVKLVAFDGINPPYTLN